MSNNLAGDLTTGVAQVAAGSIILCAVLVALAAFKMTATTPVKITALALMALLVGFAVYLFNTNEKTKIKQDPIARQYAERCHVLLATVQQGLHDKLIAEDNLRAARNVAKSLLRDIAASPCIKPVPEK